MWSVTVCVVHTGIYIPVNVKYIFIVYKRNHFKEALFSWILTAAFFFIICSLFSAVTTDVLPTEACLLDPDPFDLGTSNDALGDDLDFEDSPPAAFALKASTFAGSTVDLDFADSELFDFDVSDNDLDLESSDFELVLYVELSLDFSDDCSVFCFHDSGFDETEFDLCISGLLERDWSDFPEEGFDWSDFGDLPGSDFGAFACSVFPERFAARLASPLMGFAATPPNPLVGFAAKLARPLKGLAPELLELLLEVETWKYNETSVKKKAMVFTS